MAQQRLPFKCLDGKKWVKVTVPEYTRVVLKIGIHKLREAFGGEAATALLLPEDADLSYEFETSKDAERSDDGQESDDEDEEEVPSPVLKTDAEVSCGVAGSSVLIVYRSSVIFSHSQSSSSRRLSWRETAPPRFQRLPPSSKRRLVG
jgi:hypothetical protein